MSQLDNSVFVIYRQGNFSINEVSQKLGIKPDSFLDGEDLNKNSMWKLFCKDNNLHLEEQIESWISFLSNRNNALSELKEAGWVIELDCLTQSSEDAAVVYLESELLEKLSNLHINLKIRFWC